MPIQWNGNDDLPPLLREPGPGARHPAPDTPFTQPEVTSPRTRPTAVPTAVQQDPEPDAKPLAVMKPVLGVAAACQRFSGAFGFGKNDASPKHLARGVDGLNRLGDEPARACDPNPVRGGKPGRLSHESLSGEDCEEYFHSADFAAAGVRGATSIAAALDDIDCGWALSPLTSLETESLSGEEHGKVMTNMSGDDFESNAYSKTNCSSVHDKSARTPEPFASPPRRARLFATDDKNSEHVTVSPAGTPNAPDAFSPAPPLKRTHNGVETHPSPPRSTLPPPKARDAAGSPVKRAKLAKQPSCRSIVSGSDSNSNTVLDFQQIEHHPIWASRMRVGVGADDKEALECREKCFGSPGTAAVLNRQDSRVSATRPNSSGRTVVPLRRLGGKPIASMVLQGLQSETMNLEDFSLSDDSPYALGNDLRFNDVFEIDLARALENELAC
jgi:hypothetical protein